MCRAETSAVPMHGLNYEVSVKHPIGDYASSKSLKTWKERNKD